MSNLNKWYRQLPAFGFIAFAACTCFSALGAWGRSETEPSTTFSLIIVSGLALTLVTLAAASSALWRLEVKAWQGLIFIFTGVTIAMFMTMTHVDKSMQLFFAFLSARQTLLILLKHQETDCPPSTLPTVRLIR